MDDVFPPDDDYGSAGQGPAGGGNPHRPDGNGGSGGGQRGMRIDPGAGGDYPLDKMTRAGGSGRRRAAQMSVHDTAGRLPPQALDVEQSVLGALMIDKDAINRALEVLPDEPFYDGRHQRIYAAVRALSERSDPVDLITLTQELRRRGDLDGAGGAAYLSELTGKVASAANVEYHARIIAERSLLRRFIETATLLVGKAYDPTTDAFELLDEAEKDIFAISNLKKTNSARALGDVVMDTMKRLESISGTEGGLTGVPSAIRALDQLTAGWQPSDLIIVAARPSMGKTAFSLAIARNAALHPQRPAGVAYFSLEMSSDQLAQRLLTSEARVDAQVARTGRMNDMEWQQVARAAARLHKAPIFIDDTPGLGILELRAKCRRLKAEHDIGLIVVDYLQLMHGSGANKNGNREQEIAQISRSLKGLAKDLAVPVIALSQLSRAVENRPDKRPQLSDLRESGCLTGDTLIPLPDGRRVPLAALVAAHPEGGFDVWAADEATGRVAPARVSRAFSTGTRPVFRLTTRLGRTIRATANHPFLTVGGWKRLDALRAGEHLAAPRRLDVPQACATRTGAELALLGHLLGDGCTLPRHAIQYTTREHDLAETVANLASEVFGDAVAPRIVRQRSWYQVYPASTRHHTHGVRSAVAEWLDGMGAWGLRSWEKRVPGEVFRQPADQIGRFLRHLWATDGCVRLVMKPRPQPAIYYATSSAGLARDVQHLLLRLGINATLRAIGQGAKGRTQYHVHVSGRDDVLAFAERVGAVGAYKGASLADVAAWATAHPGCTNRDVVPAGVWDGLVRPAMQRLGLTERGFQQALGMSYCGSGLYRQNMSRARAARVAEVVHDEALARLATSDLYWDAVVSIEPDGEEEVFDLTVPGPHNFVADDLVVHNSIEQDADVVIFLHRPEKYGITTDDAGQSTEGIAEIIIGKQRNGPLGTAVAAFVKEYARFENLTTYYDGAGGYGNEPDDPFAADGGSGGALPGGGAAGLLPPGDDFGYGGGGYGGEDLPGGYGPPPGGFGDGSSMPPPFPPSDPGDAPF